MVVTFQEPGKSKTKYKWHSPQRRATWTRNLVVLNILVVVVTSIVPNWLEIDTLQRIQDGTTVTEAAITSNATRHSITGWLYSIPYFAVVVAFLMWISRASKNLSALGASNQKFSPGSAVAWWFIPIASLWVPYKVTREIWVESHPERLRPPAWFRVWWATWVVSIVLGYFSLIYFSIMAFSLMALDTNQTKIMLINSLAIAPEAILGYSLAIASKALEIAAALCLIILVRRITANQIQKHQTSADQDYPNPSPPEDQHTRPIQPSRRRQQYRTRHNYLQRWLLP